MNRSSTQSPETRLGRIDDWQKVEANNITSEIGNTAVLGKLLVGPHEVGAQAFIPPGIWANTPEGFEKPVTNKGWRHGIWTAHEDGTIWDDGTERPLTLPARSLRTIHDTIQREAPTEFAYFAEEETLNQIEKLKLYLSFEDASEEEKQNLTNELRIVSAEAAAVFGTTAINVHLPEFHPN